MAITYRSMDSAHQTRERKQIIVDRELDRLMALNGGRVTVEQFVESARDPASPVHKYFEWDNARAAHEHRKSQALQMIMTSRMVAEIQVDGTIVPSAVAHRVEVRRLVSAFRGEGFKMRVEAFQEPDERAAIVRRYAERLRGWCTATADLPELARVRAAVLRELEAMGLEEESATDVPPAVQATA